MGGTPPPLNEKSAKLLRKKYPKMTKKDVSVLNKFKMDPIGHIIDQTGLKMYEKGKK